MFHLIVTAAFADYARGARIEDAAEVEKVLAGENANKVVKVAAPAAPAPVAVVAPQPAPEPPPYVAAPVEPAAE